jgi:hypothetical protein
MSKPPVIAAFDIATKTGVCWGRPGSKPFVATWNLWEAGPFRPARLSHFWSLACEFFEDERPDIVRYEAPMNLAGMGKVGSSEETMLLLRGAIGVLEAAAFRSGIKDIDSFTVFAAREHLTGKARWKSKQGKSEVMRVAQMLGVNVSNDNEGDAFAGWSYCCGLANPRIAHLVTPLFARGP